MSKKKQNKKQQTPATFNTALLRYLKNAPHKKFSRKSIYKKFIREFSKQEMALAIAELEKEGRIVIDGSKVHLPFPAKPKRKERSGVYEGTLEMTKYGYAFVTVKDLEHDIFVSSTRLHRALDGDTVKVAIVKVRANGKMDGEVVEIVKRANNRFLGTVHVSPKFAFLIPDRRNMLHDIYIPLDKLHGARNHDKAVAVITHWPLESKSPAGEIVEVLGESGRNDIEMKSILIENGFPLSFSEEALKEAEKIPEEIPQEEIRRRRDFRGIITFTIDPDDAKDFDDALSIQQLPSGHWEVGVHIADVTHYVKPGSALDKDAAERATSVYLVDRVLPMLPEKLSNKVCSLRPDEDKLCFSTVFEMDASAKVLEIWYGKTVIRSQKRFTYREAQQALDTGKGVFAKELQTLNTLARKLRAERIRHGSIPFETTEVKFRLDENGFPLEIMLKELTDANWLIEDFMLLANRYVAKYVSKLRHGRQPVPFVYRIHDKPDMLKLEVFSQFVKNFGYNIKFSDPDEIAGQLNRLIKMVHGKKEQDVIEQLAIRSMAKAAYSTKNIGHFGLAFEHYSHFTSPIRRYPDMLAHRILEQCLSGDGILYPKELIEELCVRSSQKERDAMEAERESVKYKQVEFMSDKIGNEYDGIISGVVYKGIYVEMTETKCEGFVHVRNLGEGNFLFDEASYSLVDQDEGTTFRLGEEVRVRVIDTNLENRTIDLELAKG
ncbi:MAG TPA: ribonuclease R [Chitinophagales bacterium]|nr:ribonuclease R [Chitinophagales bacterium]